MPSMISPRFNTRKQQLSPNPNNPNNPNPSPNDDNNDDGDTHTTQQSITLLTTALAPLSTLFSIPGLTEHWYIPSVSSNPAADGKPDPPLVLVAGGFALFFTALGNLGLLVRMSLFPCKKCRPPNQPSRGARDSSEQEREGEPETDHDRHHCIHTRRVYARSQLVSIISLVSFSLTFLIDLISVIIFPLSTNHDRRQEGMILSPAFWLTVVSGVMALIVAGCFGLEGLTGRSVVNGGGVSTWKKGNEMMTLKQRSWALAYAFFMLWICLGTLVNRFLIPRTYYGNLPVTYVDSLYFNIQTLITTGFGDIVPQSRGSRIFSYFHSTIGIVGFALVVGFTRDTVLEWLEDSYKKREKRFLRMRARFGGSSMFLKQKKDSSGSRSSGGDGNHTRKEEKLEQEAQNVEDALEDMQLMRRRDFRAKIIVSVFGFMVFWLVGSIPYIWLENWGYWDSLWFSYVAFTSIGYGDFYPQTQGGRAFFIAWSLFGAGQVTILFSVFQEAWSSYFTHSLMGEEGTGKNPYKAAKEGEIPVKEEDYPYAKELGILDTKGEEYLDEGKPRSLDGGEERLEEKGKGMGDKRHEIDENEMEEIRKIVVALRNELDVMDPGEHKDDWKSQVMHSLEQLRSHVERLDGITSTSSTTYSRS